MRAQINVTPFVDVLLVLLILFMVITPLAQRGLDVSLPRTNPGPTPPVVTPTPAPLILEVRADGLVLNGRHLATLGDLQAGLGDVMADRPGRSLFLWAEGVSYGDVVAALDTARGAGIGRIGILHARPSGP